jgi:hypothetical protein
MRKAPLTHPSRRAPSRRTLAAVAALGSLLLGLVAACDDTVPAAASGTSGGTGATSASTGSESTTTSTGGPTTSSSSTGSGGTDSGTPVDRGPKNLPIDGDPEGLWWDPVKGTLFIADNDNNRILQWTDAGGFGTPITLPPAPACGPGLGQVVETSDDMLYVTRFGFGTSGDIAFVKTDGTGGGTIPHLDPTKRRLGLTVASDGTLYDSYFVLQATGQVGAVAQLGLSGTETDIVTGLGKPVGVLAVGGTLFISDQAQNAVFTALIASPAKLTQLVSIPTPDLLSGGPSGSVYTGGNATVRQVLANGTFTVTASGYHDVRGTAYDVANTRLFVGDHVSGTTGSITIVPVN